MTSPSVGRLAWAALLIALPATAQTSIHAQVEKHGEEFSVVCQLDFPAPPTIAWQVLTDFEHMPEYLSSLRTSHAIPLDAAEQSTAGAAASATTTSLLVRQTGVARLGIVAYRFASEREVHLEAMTRISSWQRSGDARSYTSEMQLAPDATDNGKTHAWYHAEVVPDTALAGLFGAAFLQHEIEEQLTAMAHEMARRAAQSSLPLPTGASNPAATE